MDGSHDTPDEPLQKLPAGLPRGKAVYRPADPRPSPPPPTNVGGYEELARYVQGKGLALPRNEEGLALVDRLLAEETDESNPLVELGGAIGMFYGDVLTHTIPGAHWEVIIEGQPTVRITRKSAVAVLNVARRLLDAGRPTLSESYDHFLALVREER